SNSNSVRSTSSACFSCSGRYEDPRRLQATRSAFGATAAVGSTCSSVSRSTTASRFSGRGPSSSCARTAMRRACVFVSRCTGERVGDPAQVPWTATDRESRLRQTLFARGAAAALGERGRLLLPPRDRADPLPAEAVGARGTPAVHPEHPLLGRRRLAG